jgi:hypothetical protein
MSLSTREKYSYITKIINKMNVNNKLTSTEMEYVYNYIIKNGHVKTMLQLKDNIPIIIYNINNLLNNKNKKYYDKEIFDKINPAADNDKVYYIDKLFNTEINKLKKEINIKSAYRIENIVLDSFNQNKDYKRQNSSSAISWNYNNSVIFSENSTTTVNNVQNLVGIRVFPIKFRKSSIDVTKNAIVAPMMSYNMLIHEFAAQSFIGNNNRRFHIMFDMLDFSYIESVRNTSIISYLFSFELVPKNDGYFWFNPPIKTFSSLTIDFADKLAETSLLLKTFTTL